MANGTSRTMALFGTTRQADVAGGPVTKIGAKHGRGPIDEKVRDRVAARIREAMAERYPEARGNVRSLARRMDISHSYLTRVLNGQQTPGLELILRCHRVLRIPYDDLLENDADPKWYKPENLS